MELRCEPTPEYWSHIKSFEAVLFHRNKCLSADIFPEVTANEVWKAEFKDDQGADMVAYNALKTALSRRRKVVLTHFSSQDLGDTSPQYVRLYQLDLRQKRESLRVVSHAAILSKAGMSYRDVWAHGFSYRMPKKYFGKIEDLTLPDENDYAFVANELARGGSEVFTTHSTRQNRTI